MTKRIVVIGGGAAGLMAAGSASGPDNEVIICEKNNILGKKLLITGKGRCNITNNCDIDDLINNIPGNGNFLYSSFYTFSNKDIIDFFESRGLKTKIERGGRVFPESDKSSDVVAVLKNFVHQAGVKVLYNTAISEILCRDGRVWGVKTEKEEIINCDRIILTTGGASYPGTGSTGDGYKILSRLGHTIIPPRPSLVPLETSEGWVRDLQGLSLKNVKVVFRNSLNKNIYSDFGEMLFTHFGVSGPVILSGSRHLLDYGYRDIKLIIDLKPALNEETLDKRIQRDFEKYSRKQFKNSLDDLLPKKMIPVFIQLSGIPEDKPVNQITKEERRNMIRLMKELTLTVSNSRSLKEAIVTAGGVSVDEINPGTMESKLVKGLYVAGEVLDLDGYTGGFNLTIAFSTGYMAGINAKD